jgi:hypothetical protein
MTGLAQPDASRIVNGVVRDYSVMRLMRVLNALGKDIHSGWSDAAHEHGGVPGRRSKTLSESCSSKPCPTC